MSNPSNTRNTRYLGFRIPHDLLAEIEKEAGDGWTEKLLSILKDGLAARHGKAKAIG